MNNYVAMPTVFAVGNGYRIMVRCDEKALMWIKVGDKCFYDHSNGILRSDTDIHGITVPAELLDEQGSYTVCKRVMIERKPYFSETGDVEEKTYDFYPVKGDKIRAYHIADAHNKIEEPVKAAQTYGKIDFLILNGDIPDHSGDIKNFDNIYELCGRITQGSIPVVFSRGNHDMRGICAENLAEYTPTYEGKSYFTVRLGGFFGIILDCGEDKTDDHAEYGNTICCHAFRTEQTEFLKDVIKKGEYSSDEIFCRAVISHNPFTQRHQPPFDIEEDIFNEWTSLLNDYVKPNVMLCGHTHKIRINRPGDESDVRGQKFATAELSETDYKEYYAGAGIEFNKNGEIKITITDSYGNVKEGYDI